jgi:hypothetical protein
MTEGEVKNEQSRGVGVNARHSQNSWESTDSIDEGVRSDLGGLSMPVVGGGLGGTKKESKLIQVEVSAMKQGTIVEI